MSATTFSPAGASGAGSGARVRDNRRIMRKLMRRNLWAHKRRLVTSFVSVLLGVSFLVGANVLTDSLRRVFGDLFDSVYAGVDSHVQGVKSVGESGPYSDGRALVPLALLDTVRAVDGVASAEPNIQGKAVLIDARGKRVGSQAPTFGINWPDDTKLNPYRIFSGRPPRADDEIVIDRASAKNGKFSNGDRVKVNTAIGTEEFTLVGQATFGSSDGALGSTATFFTAATAQRVMQQPGFANSIEARARDGVTQAQLTERINAALKRAGGAEAVTGAQLVKDTKGIFDQFFKFFGYFFTAFALIALFVSTFVIYNSFSILAAQRLRETGLLRAIGASGSQIRRANLIESLLIGLAASVLGLFAGLGVAQALKLLLNAAGGSLPSAPFRLPPATIWTALLVGVGVTMVSSAVPAFRAARTKPLAALRAVSVDRSSRSKVRIVIGTLLLLVSALALVTGWGMKGGDGALRIGEAAGAALLAVIFLGPVLVKPLAAALGTKWYGTLVVLFGGVLGLAALASAVFGVFKRQPLAVVSGAWLAWEAYHVVGAGIGSFRTDGRIAQRNAMRSPQRTASTALALTIGVALVSTLGVFMGSITETFTGAIDRQVKADHLVVASDNDGFSSDVATRVAKVPGVQAATALRVDRVKVKGSGGDKGFGGVDARAISAVIDLGAVDGEIARLADDGTVAVSKQAKKRSALGFPGGRYALGDTIDATFSGGKSTALKVVALYENAEALNNTYYLVGIATMEKYSTRKLDAIVYLKSDGRKGFGDAANKVIADVPNATVQTKKQFKARVLGQLAQFLSLVSGLLGLAIVIAVLGIANTLLLSIYERTREIGLMRAVGMTRAQTKTAIRWEAVVVASIGAVIGLAIGTLFGAALVHVLAKDGTLKLAVPWAPLGALALFAALVGVWAARKPAKRAAKLNVLAAIATE